MNWIIPFLFKNRDAVNYDKFLIIINSIQEYIYLIKYWKDDQLSININWFIIHILWKIKYNKFMRFLIVNAHSQKN
jgi:hypothetical protein